MEYYKKIELEEHMLYASEIALKYKILTPGGNTHHTMLVSALIKDYIKDKDYIQLYYNTRRGMTKVYPYEIYHNAIKEFLLNNKNNIKLDDVNSVKIGNKNYNFLWDYEKISYMYNYDI